MQQSFGFTNIKIDFRKTRSNVYKKFDRYRYLLNLLPMEQMPGVTQNLSFIPPSTKKSLNAIENYAEKALERVKLENEMDQLTFQFDTALETLSPLERTIIIRKYLKNEQESDYLIYNDLSLGRSKYYSLKRHAVNKIGFYLSLEVYKK